MATLEDKILGEKLHYYCSSGESSGDDADDDDKDEKPKEDCVKNNLTAASYRTNLQRNGSSVNTGPKGVLKDWQQFKQHENEKRKEEEDKYLEGIKKRSLTCQSNLDQEKSEDDELEKELLQDAFLQEYLQKRMSEMYTQVQNCPSFGSIFQLNDGNEFLNAIDNAPKDAVIIIHLYEDGNPCCDAMNGCLTCLANDYRHIKFCKLKASAARVSRRFQRMGVPAFLIYKNGQMLGNFVRLGDEFGEDFFASDVESFLIEHGMLTDKSLVPQIIRNSTSNEELE